MALKLRATTNRHVLKIAVDAIHVYRSHRGHCHSSPASLPIAIRRWTKKLIIILHSQSARLYIVEYRVQFSLIWARANRNESIDWMSEPKKEKLYEFIMFFFLSFVWFHSRVSIFHFYLFALATLARTHRHGQCVPLMIFFLLLELYVRSSDT